MIKSKAEGRKDLHQTITDKIVAAIEAGAGDWHMPWHRPGTAFSIPRNALTDARYQGCNILSLWIDADAKKFDTPVWATFKQWQQLGAQVRKGEKGSLIVKYGRWTPKDARDEKPETQGDDASGERMFARAAWVFNANQVDGYTLPDAKPVHDLTVRLAHVDEFLANTGIEFREGGARAYYRRPTSDGHGDYVQMPPRHLFTGSATSTPTEAYESTRLHEAGHATGASHRLNREFGQRFGDDQYAMEELVGELTACFMSAELHITNAPRADHAQYLAHWLKVLKADNRAIFTAAAHATRAAQFLIGLQPPEVQARMASRVAAPSDDTDENNGRIAA